MPAGSSAPAVHRLMLSPIVTLIETLANVA